MAKTKTALIFGITGQDGSYLSEILLKKGYLVHGVVRRASTFNTTRINHLYQDPHKKDRRLFLHHGDLADAGTIRKIIYKVKPDEIYNLGAQSHVKVSFEIPEYTMDITGNGALRILEAIRDFQTETSKKVKFYQASSSEMFGSAPPPQNENTPFIPKSPYGAAKLFAYNMTNLYRDAYGLFAVSGILFNHECITAQTPIIIKKKGLIDIVAIEEIVPHRENPLKGKKYTTISNNNYLELWDKNKWSKIKSMTATWNKAGNYSDKKIRGVVCRGGYYEASYDHISYIREEKEIKTGDIKAGNHLELGILPALTKKIIMTSEEAEFIGMMVADGYISSDGNGRFINNNSDLRKRISELWEKVSGGYSREDKHPSGFNESKSVHSVEFAGNRQYLSLIHKEIYNEKLFKKVPKRILNASNDIIINFLKGYNICDGLKAGHQKTEFKSFTTNSQVLGSGLWYLVNNVLNLRITLHPEYRGKFLYFHLNVNSDHAGGKGKHLRQEISEVKLIKNLKYNGWLFDLETDSGTFSAGMGLTWVHNSPRRGETFVTRKITRSIARIKAGLDKKLYLGNLDAKRDWGYSPEYMEAAWLMMQQPKPDDYVIGTGETHTVKEFVELAFKEAGLGDWKKYVKIDSQYYRPAEVDILVADARKARRVLKWQPKTKFKDLVKIMVWNDINSLKI